MVLATGEPAIGDEPTPQPQPQPQPPTQQAVSHNSQVPQASQPVAFSPDNPDPAPPASDAGADAGSEAPVNPRKRKKASRACDFCHVNHQPCDNGKPKCSVCTKHNKPCLYLRPTKRRGPQKGYRTALNTYKESAAAWGAVLSAIPGLDALIEGHLRGNTGRNITASIKDSNQQDALITKWQQSSVFRAFFGHNGPPAGLMAATDSNSAAAAAAAAAALSQELEDEDAGDETPPARPPPPAPLSRISQQFASQTPTLTHTHTTQSSHTPSSFAVAPPEPKPPTSSLGSPFQPQDTLSDIVAKDAAQSATRASQTLASLGFAPDETIADFYTMGSNPEPMPEANDPDFDPSLGSEAEQRAYYELLMGRSFFGG